MNDYVSTLLKLNESLELNKSLEGSPPKSTDLQLTMKALRQVFDRGDNRNGLNFDKTFLEIMQSNGKVLSCLQYFTVLHLTLSDVFTSLDLYKDEKMRYENYKKDARTLWGWKAKSVLSFNNNRVNFKDMVQDDGIKKLLIKINLITISQVIDFLYKLSVIIHHANINISRIKENEDYRKKLLTEKRQLCNIYDAIYKGNESHEGYKSFASFKNGGKHTSRKNRTKRKQRTRKH